MIDISLSAGTPNRRFFPEKKAVLDKKGISAENIGATFLDHCRPTSKNTGPNEITGDRSRDKSIRLSGLSTRYDYLSIQRQYAPTKAMRTCSRYTVASLVKEDDNGKYTLVKETGTNQRRKHYLSSDSIESIPEMKLKVTEYGSSITGLQTCDNPFCCMCSRTRAMERAETIKGVLKLTQERNWGQYFVTLTIERQKCAKTAVKEIQDRWRKVQKRLQYFFKKKTGHQIEFMRAVDVTFRPELQKIGQVYHVHLHTIILIDRRINKEIVRNHILKAWMNGGNASIRVDEKGQDIQDVRDSEKLAKYVSKMSGLGLELAYSQTKKGKGKSLSLPQILEAIADGNYKLGYLYKEFLMQMKNVRTMSFSRGIKFLFQEYQKQEAENAENTEENAAASLWDITIPPEWWAAVISVQSRLVQSAYYWFQMSDKRAEKLDILRNLLETNPQDKTSFLMMWIDGSLSDSMLLFATGYIKGD
jgi:hypothetical protein